MNEQQTIYIYSHYETDSTLHQCTAKSLKDIVDNIIAFDLEGCGCEVELTDTYIEWDDRREEYPTDLFDLAEFIENLRDELGYPHEKVVIKAYSLQAVA
ncbi:hypothetical protein AWB71_05291 [Caballeronia peredens]|nr:hypothetical protein AWB71_05291 [Caballeronia peredens]